MCTNNKRTLPSKSQGHTAFNTSKGTFPVNSLRPVNMIIM